MPIEPVKPMNLADVWNPMQSLGPAVQLQQIGLQQQQLDVQGQRMQVEALEAVAKNPDVNPIERYRSVSRLLEMGGVKTDPGEFMALPNLWTNTALSMVENGPDSPETLRLGSELLQKSPLFRSQFEAHQKMARQAQNVKGLQSLGSQAAGRNLSMAEAEAAAQSPNIQKQVAETVFQGPLEQARAKQINDNVDALKVREGQLSTMQQQLVAYANPTFIDLNTESAYRQTIAAGGDTKAGSLLESVKMDNDDLAINTGTLTKAERAEASQRVEQEITALRTKQRELQGNIRKARDLAGTAGVIDPTTYESELQAVTAALNVKLAEKPYLKTFAQPDFDRLQSTYDTYNNLVQSNKDQILAVRNAAVGLRTAAIDEKKAEFQVKQDYQARLIKAQEEFSKTDLSPKAAGPIGAKYQVLPDDVLNAGKLPNQPLVTINQKQETAEAAKVGEAFGTEYADLQKSAVAASQQISKLDRMEQLMQGVQTGKLTPAVTQVQALAESLGFQVDATLPAKQALESLSNEIALQLRNPAGGAGMPGAMSDKDREFLQSMTPGLAKTPEGNRLIIDTARKLAKRSQEVAKMARDYRKKYGHFDEGFFDELQSYSDKHPLFKQVSASSGVSSGPVNITSDADYNALPPGTVYIDPEGKQRTKKK